MKKILTGNFNRKFFLVFEQILFSISNFSFLLGLSLILPIDSYGIFATLFVVLGLFQTIVNGLFIDGLFNSKKNNPCNIIVFIVFWWLIYSSLCFFILNSFFNYVNFFIFIAGFSYSLSWFFRRYFMSKGDYKKLLFCTFLNLVMIMLVFLSVLFSSNVNINHSFILFSLFFNLPILIYIITTHRFSIKKSCKAFKNYHRFNLNYLFISILCWMPINFYLLINDDFTTNGKIRIFLNYIIPIGTISNVLLLIFFKDLNAEKHSEKQIILHWSKNFSLLYFSYFLIIFLSNRLNILPNSFNNFDLFCLAFISILSFVLQFSGFVIKKFYDISFSHFLFMLFLFAIYMLLIFNSFTFYQCALFLYAFILLFFIKVYYEKN